MADPSSILVLRLRAKTVLHLGKQTKEGKVLGTSPKGLFFLYIVRSDGANGSEVLEKFLIVVFFG